MGIRISQVDAFTDRRFAGNPAAVCVLAEPAEDRWMQDVAAEMNLSETAFARRLGPSSKFSLRWFTPRSEVDLCGHATLATAHVLWEEEHLPAGEPAFFETRSGLLTARADRAGSSSISPRSRSARRSRTSMNSASCGRPSRHRSGSPDATGSTSWSRSKPRSRSAACGRTSAGSSSSRFVA